MPNVWIWNIARDYQQFFADELKAGRLRQGWGYDDRLDLRLIAKKHQGKQPLDEEESAAWKRLSVMSMDWGIKLGDVILVKNIPMGHYTIVEVIGGYQYDRTTNDDFGHYISIKPLCEVNKYSAHVAGDLRSSIDNQRWPITAAVKRASEILGLLKLSSDERTRPRKWKERLASQSSAVIGLIKEQVVKKLHPSEFEDLVKGLLDSEKFENIKLTAGAGENGADLVMSVSAPFFDDLNIVVQIKRHLGEDNDPTSIDQLRRAFDYYKAVAGLLVTAGDKIGPKLQEALEKLRTEGKTVAVLHGEELYRRVLYILATETSDGA